MAEQKNTVDQQVFGEIKRAFSKWLNGAPEFTDRYTGDDGRSLHMDEYPLLSVDQQTAIQAEWSRLQGEVGIRRTTASEERK